MSNDEEGLSEIPDWKHKLMSIISLHLASGKEFTTYTIQEACFSEKSFQRASIPSRRAIARHIRLVGKLENTNISSVTTNEREEGYINSGSEKVVYQRSMTYFRGLA